MRFTLDIEMGNDAMKDGRDVAEALRTLASTIDDHTIPSTHTIVVRTIRDTNGNRVGIARFVSDDSPEALDCVILKITPRRTVARGVVLLGGDMDIYDGCRVSVHATQAEAEQEFRDWIEEHDDDASQYTVAYEPTYLDLPTARKES